MTYAPGDHCRLLPGYLVEHADDCPNHLPGTVTNVATAESTFIHIEPSLQGVRAWGILYDCEANTLAETESRQYIGYSRGEVKLEIIAELQRQAAARLELEPA